MLQQQSQGQKQQQQKQTEAVWGRSGKGKGGKERGEKGVARDINNCDSCVDMASWAITGRFQGRNAEQISQTVACA